MGTKAPCGFEVMICGSQDRRFNRLAMSVFNNYRGITLLSCMLKTYTTILNNRFMKWLQDNSVLTDAQFEFRQGLGTVDAVY